MGPRATDINGTYLPTNEKVNGMTTYVKVEKPARCLYRATDGSWYATDVANKDLNKCVGSAFSIVEGLTHPTLAKEWMVLDYEEEWAQQPMESLLMVSLLTFIIIMNRIQGDEKMNTFRETEVEGALRCFRSLKAARKVS